MTRRFSRGVGSIALCLVAGAWIALPASADQPFPARLEGRAILPAASFIAPPPDAGDWYAISGRFMRGGRVDAPESRGRPGELPWPFRGQPIQGLSGVAIAADGDLLAIADNGFGARANSQDALLGLHRLRPNWADGSVAVVESVFLADPNGIARFPTIGDPTATRYLTGSDFDPESLARIGDRLFVGEEFGPYVMEIDRAGRLVDLHEAALDGAPLRSIDHPALRAAYREPSTPHRVPRSGGFEALAATPDGARLWAFLEKPLRADPEDAAPEGGEAPFVRILEFDVAAARWTGRGVKHRLADGAAAIGGADMIGPRTALVIERDWGQGDPARACPDQQRSLACFPRPARVKRVSLIDWAEPDADGFARVIGHIDLMDIAAPDGGRFTFPFVTVEAVARVDEARILVMNDNNLPGSRGRAPDRPDDTEIILLNASEMLAAGDRRAY